MGEILPSSIERAIIIKYWVGQIKVALRTELQVTKKHSKGKENQFANLPIADVENDYHSSLDTFGPWSASC